MSAASCSRHPEREAKQVCERCGVFSCATCARQAGARRWCADCYWRWARARASPLAWTAHWLVLLGFITCGFAGVAGLVVAVLELRRIERGDAPLAGRFLARAARTMGFTQLVWLLFLVIIPVITALRFPPR